MHSAAGAAFCALVLVIPTLTFRTIDPVADGELAYHNYRDACAASFGSDVTCMPRDAYRRWLGRRVDEFPEGHVLALQGERCVGQLEIEVPYGRTVGYVNLFCVSPPFRRKGFGRVVHDFAERYCRSWDAGRIALDVSPENRRAVGFYRHLGYRFTHIPGELARLWRMEKAL